MLIPYRLRQVDDATTVFGNAVLRKRMAVENLITGTQEVLVFSKDRYAAVGYVPNEVAQSQSLGLFLMADGSFRLVDKLGNEFHFDPTGRLIDICSAGDPDNHLHIEYVDGFVNDFGDAPYVVELGHERMSFLNGVIPRTMKVTNSISGESESLTFSSEGQVAGYVPASTERSRYRMLALLSDYSTQLVDKQGNEIRFNPDGKFVAFCPANQPDTVRELTMGKQTLRFSYTVDRNGRLMIAKASLSLTGRPSRSTSVVHYNYDKDGQLVRARL